MFKRSTTSECGVTQHTTTTIQYERYNTDGAKICSRKQRTKYDRRYDEEANRARRRGSVSGKPERHTRENFHTHYDSSPLTFGRHEEPMSKAKNQLTSRTHCCILGALLESRFDFHPFLLDVRGQLGPKASPLWRITTNEEWKVGRMAKPSRKPSRYDREKPYHFEVRMKL